MNPRHVVVSLTQAEADTVRAALELYAQEVEEGTGTKDAAATRALRKLRVSTEKSAAA